MSYAVHHRDVDGVVHLEEAATQDEALAIFERLRNQDGPSELRVFHEVPVEVRTYYKVVAVASDGPDDDAVGDADRAEASHTEPVTPDGDVDVPAAVDATSTDEGVGSPDGAVVEEERLAPPPAPSGPLDAPSGAVVMSPPVTVPHDRSDDDAYGADTAPEPRRQLFGRG